MLTTQKNLKQQRLQIDVLAWVAFYGRLAQILKLKDRIRLKKKLKAKYQKNRRLKHKAHQAKMAKHGFFAHKTPAITAQPVILSYNKSRPLSWRKP